MLGIKALVPFLQSRSIELLVDQFRVRSQNDYRCFGHDVEDGMTCQVAAGYFTIAVNGTWADRPQVILNEAMTILQKRIDSGDLECELKALYPNSTFRIENGGGCEVAVVEDSVSDKIVDPSTPE